MPDEFLYALKIYLKSDEEIEKEIIELYDYFINLGVDFDTLLKFNSLCIERAIRSVNNERV